MKPPENRPFDGGYYFGVNGWPYEDSVMAICIAASSIKPTLSATFTCFAR
jgi:hypothetical protein